MRTELEYWNEMAGGVKQSMGNLCPGDAQQGASGAGAGGLQEA